MSMEQLLEEIHDYVESRGTTHQPRAYDMARLIVDLMSRTVSPVAWAVYWKDGQGLVSNGLSYVCHSEPHPIHMDQVKVPLYTTPPDQSVWIEELEEKNQSLVDKCNSHIIHNTKLAEALRKILDGDTSFSSLEKARKLLK